MRNQYSNEAQKKPNKTQPKGNFLSIAQELYPDEQILEHPRPNLTK